MVLHSCSEHPKPFIEAGVRIDWAVRLNRAWYISAPWGLKPGYGGPDFHNGSLDWFPGLRKEVGHRACAPRKGVRHECSWG